MQPRIVVSTFALAMGVSGLAWAGGTTAGDQHEVSRGTQSAAPSNAPAVSREQTMEMQRALMARNLYQGKADGLWGPKTESALRNFQTQSGLEVTGTLDESTARALGIDATMERQPVSGTDAPAAGSAATPNSQTQVEDRGTNVELGSLSQEQAREMQQRLQLLGYYRGAIDGKVGEGTRAALQRYFQRQAELAQQGVISNSAISLFGTEVTDVRR